MNMKRIVLLASVLVFLSTAAVVRFISPVVSYPEETERLTIDLRVHNIDSGKNFSTIQEAINDNETLGGHTILVDAGTYYEHVIVNKSISLIGENESTTIINGNETGTVVYVTTNSVSLSGFTVQNGSEGISLYHCQSCSINGNRVLGNDREGIGLLGSSNNRIESNVISHNFWGIHLMFDLPICGSTDNAILNNLITNNKHGITFFSHSNCNEIIENTIASNDDTGIYLTGRNNIVHNNRVLNNTNGVAISWGSSNSTISRNVILNSSFVGISMSYSNSNRVLGNILNNSEIGLWARNINDCMFRGNTISMNNEGIQILFSGDNALYHNNLINNTLQANSYNSTSIWDNGFEGNYWSDYNGTDFYSGPYQNITGSDGIGDFPYDIDASNQDNYPLMGIFFDFPVAFEEKTYHVTTISNSTISEFQFTNITEMIVNGEPIVHTFNVIIFDVTGEDGTLGFCRIYIPTALLNDTYKVFVDGTEISYSTLPCSNSTHSYLYFTYNHSTQEVVIVPEFPTWTSLLLLLNVLTVAIAIYKRRPLKTQIQ